MCTGVYEDLRVRRGELEIVGFMAIDSARSSGGA